jgi:hypothetical protein
MEKAISFTILDVQWYPPFTNVPKVWKYDESGALLELGFEYVCQKDNLIFLRKRK